MKNSAFLDQFKASIFASNYPLLVLEIILILIFIFIWFRSHNKMGAYFTAQFFLGAIAWVLQRTLYLDYFHMLTSPQTVFHRHGPSAIIYLSIALICYYSIRLAEKHSGKTIIEGKLPLSFWLRLHVYFIALSYPLLLFFHLFSLLRPGTLPSGEFLDWLPFAELFLFNLEAFFFVYLIRRVYFFMKKYKQGAVYLGSLQFLLSGFALFPSLILLALLQYFS